MIGWDMFGGRKGDGLRVNDIAYHPYFSSVVLIQVFIVRKLREKLLQGIW